ncbi:MAG: hypothetical protein DRI65_13230 [Chloroflexota bacterium]|nr:MAG: hypothetical protein DRI65_13230 [Chloroflexota bacterium]
MAQLENEVTKAREAKALKSSILNKFFADRDETLWEAFQNTKIGDTEMLAQIHTQLKSLNALKSELRTIEETGLMAQVALDKEG